MGSNQPMAPDEELCALLSCSRSPLTEGLSIH